MPHSLTRLLALVSKRWGKHSNALFLSIFKLFFSTNISKQQDKTMYYKEVGEMGLIKAAVFLEML